MSSMRPSSCRARSEPHGRSSRALRVGDHVGAVRVVGVVEDQTRCWGTMFTSRRKLSLNFIHVLVDVGVVELDVVDDDQFGQVVDELAALVEKRGVVFVALDDVIGRVVEPRALGRDCWAGRRSCSRGRGPRIWSTQVSRLVVVVLPCVPVTTRLWRPRRKKNFNTSGSEQ